MGAKYVNKVEDSTGYKKTKIGVLPSDWEVKKLSDVSCINRESLNGNIEADYEFYYYDLSCVDNGKIYKPNNKIKFKDAPSRARRVFQKNDILFSMVRPYLKGFAYIDFECKDCICSTGFSVISSNKANDAKFIYYNLFGTVIENQVNKLLVGSNYPAINSSDVENLKIPYPKLDMEREKIGHILSTWDKAIELKEKLIEQKKEQKKGLMQRLLTGKVRFSGFDKEWRSVPIESVCELSMGKTPSRKVQKYWGKGHKWIAISDMKDKYITNTQEEITDLALKETGIQVIPKGTVIMSFKLTLGRLAITGEDMYSNEAIVSFRIKNPDVLDYEFLYYYLSSIDITKYGSQAAKGITLNSDSLKEIMIKLPTKCEQIKIRDALCFYDKEIDLLEQELEALKQQKKGLMQLLLTGKVRVKC